MRKLTPEELARKRTPAAAGHPHGSRLPIYGLLDNIRSLYNVGSMFRTSDGAGVAKLCLCGYTPRPPRKEIEKTSLGSVHTVPWEHFPDALQAVRELKRAGVAICVLEQTTGSVPYHSIPHPRFPVCLAVGNEITGVSSSVIAEADFAIEIPMHGMKHSLNAAVAYGIGIYELVRLWKEQGVTAGDRAQG